MMLEKKTLGAISVDKKWLTLGAKTETKDEDSILTEEERSDMMFKMKNAKSFEETYGIKEAVDAVGGLPD